MIFNLINGDNSYITTTNLITIIFTNINIFSKLNQLQNGITMHLCYVLYDIIPYHIIPYHIIHYHIIHYHIIHYHII